MTEEFRKDVGYCLSDDLSKNDEDYHTVIPNRQKKIHVGTFNILFDIHKKDLIFSSIRFPRQIDMYEKMNLDILALTEVTWDYLDFILNFNNFIKKNYNFVTTLNHELEKPPDVYYDVNNLADLNSSNCAKSENHELFINTSEKNHVTCDTTIALNEKNKNCNDIPHKLQGIVGSEIRNHDEIIEQKFDNNDISKNKFKSFKKKKSEQNKKTTQIILTDKIIKEAANNHNNRLHNGCLLLSKYKIESYSYIHFRAVQISRPALVATVLIPLEEMKNKQLYSTATTEVPNGSITEHVKYYRLMVVVVHLKAYSKCETIRTSQLADIFRIIDQKKFDCDDILIMGDFNMSSPKEFKNLRSKFLREMYIDVWEYLKGIDENSTNAGATFDYVKNPFNPLLDPESGLNRRNRYDCILKLSDRFYHKHQYVSNKIREQYKNNFNERYLIPKNIELFGTEPIYPSTCLTSEEIKKLYHEFLNKHGIENDMEKPKELKFTLDKTKYLMLSDHFGIRVEFNIPD